MEDKDPDELVKKAKKKLDPGFFQSYIFRQWSQVRKSNELFQ